MNQEIITRILATEQEAVQIREDAQREAARLIEDTQRETAAAGEQALEAARQEAEQIVADGKTAAERTRADVVGQAQGEAQRLEAAMVQHLDRAVQFVLERVTGQA
jgi:vacuolar-type H+-ATPase subunit H